MVFHVFYPALAILVLFIAMCIMIMLRYGPKLCKLRHTAKPPEYDWEDKTYEQKVSYAWHSEQPTEAASSSRLSDVWWLYLQLAYVNS